jgi:predicted metalloprotease
MRWREMQPSQNVEDRRGMRAGFGGGRGFRTGGLGLGGLLILMVLGYFITGDPLGLMGGDGTIQPAPAETGPRGAPADEAGDRISRVLGDTEQVWSQLFAQQNRAYRKPTLVLFSEAVDSACGFNSSAVGPFYCPGDHRLYIDLAFFNELDRRFGAPGDFAQAYVVAHEVGHHVQNLLGVFERARSMAQSRADPNAISVSQELMADCFAGIWGHYAAARNLLEPGDVEEGLTAAAAIGDDRIQKRTQGQVTPETWTHGSSAERVKWFRHGLETGQIRSCDTFASS